MANSPSIYFLVVNAILSNIQQIVKTFTGICSDTEVVFFKLISNNKRLFKAQRKQRTLNILEQNVLCALMIRNSTAYGFHVMSLLTALALVLHGTPRGCLINYVHYVNYINYKM